MFETNRRTSLIRVFETFKVVWAFLYSSKITSSSIYPSSFTQLTSEPFYSKVFIFAVLLYSCSFSFRRVEVRFRKKSLIQLVILEILSNPHDIENRQGAAKND